MMTLLARLHGTRNGGAPGRSTLRRSAALGVATGAVVLAHLVALGFAGTLLFLRSGVGYSGPETVLLAILSAIAGLSFVHAARHLVRSRRTRRQGHR